MDISQADWIAYKDKLSAISDTAADKFEKWLTWKGGYQNVSKKEMINMAYALTTKYGEAAASLAAQMYDETAALSGVTVPAAEVANTASYGEIAKAINGVTKTLTTDKNISNVVARHTKMAGADTTLKNAARDGAEFAWIPAGDTCIFCLEIASNGWRHISAKSMKNGHAEHIHANCDCTYSVRFDGKSNVKGYNPEKYKEMFKNAEGNTSQEKVNSLRRIQYQENKDKINAQKRANYIEKKLESGAKNVKILGKNLSSNGIHSAKGSVLYPFSHDTTVKPAVLEAFNKELEKAQSKFGNISTIKNIFTLNTNSNDEGIFYDNGGMIGLRHANKKDGLQTMAKIAKQKFSKGEWSTSDPYHVMRHEIAHAIQYEHRLNDSKWDNKLERIYQIYDDALNNKNNRVFPSSYAATDPNEFISECIAASYKKNPSSTVKKVVSIILEE